MKKGFYKSKTYWFNVIVAVCAFYPPVTEFMQSNTAIITAVWAGLNMALMAISKNKISLTD